MVFVSSGKFIFNAGGGILSALFDGYFNPCVPQTQGLNSRQQVTVRVRQGISQQVENSTELVVITVETVKVILPSQQNIQNPVQANQPQSLSQEIQVSQIPVQGNSALEEFNNADIPEEPGLTFLLPPIAKPERMAEQVAGQLGKEVAAQSVAARELADDVAKAATSSVDDAARLAAKLKGLSSAQIQQVLQKAGLSFTDSRAIATAANNLDEAAQLLRQQGLSAINNIQRNVASQLGRMSVAVCP